MSHTSLLEKTGGDFVAFAVSFLNLVKCNYRGGDTLRLHSQGFLVLTELNQRYEKQGDRQSFTMSEMADSLQITKQQLTRLSNDLEEKKLIRRDHDPENRRQVYISITEEGRGLMKQVQVEILQNTLQTMSDWTEEELAQMNEGISLLMPLIGRFDSCCKNKKNRGTQDDNAK